MTDPEIRSKLAECFAAVFPKLDPAQAAIASADNIREWDSVAQVNLLTVIGEEFEIEIDFEEFEGATSFEALADRIAQVKNAA